MSTKKGKRKGKKRGGRRAAPASSVPKQTKEELANIPNGSKKRNWYGRGGLKERYMAYEFLTYTDMARVTGVPEGQIGKHAMVRRDQPETWKDERTRKTRELADARHEADKAKAADFNAEIRKQILLTADTLEGVGRNSLVTQAGLVMVVPSDAIRALGESARIKQAMVVPDKTQQGRGVRGDEGDDGDAGDVGGLVVMPPRMTLEQWEAGRRTNLVAPQELPASVEKKKK